VIYNFDNSHAEKMKYNTTKVAKNNKYNYFNEKKSSDVGGDSDDAGHWSPLHHSHDWSCGADESLGRVCSGREDEKL